MDKDRDGVLDTPKPAVRAQLDTVERKTQARQRHQVIDGAKEDAKDSLNIAIGGRLAAAKDPLRDFVLVPPAPGEHAAERLALQALLHIVRDVRAVARVLSFQDARLEGGQRLEHRLLVTRRRHQSKPGGTGIVEVAQE